MVVGVLSELLRVKEIIILLSPHSPSLPLKPMPFEPLGRTALIRVLLAPEENPVQWSLRLLFRALQVFLVFEQDSGVAYVIASLHAFDLLG